jgi:hypothetical protein
MWMKLAGRLSASMTPDAYFAQAYDLAGQIRHSQRHFRIGNRMLRLEFATPALPGRLTHALQHLETPARDAALTVRCFDSGSSHLPMPAPPWTHDDYLARGAIRGWEDGDYRAHYLMNHHHLHLDDQMGNRGVYWAQKPSFVPWWEQTFPMRQMIHWWGRDRQYQPIHAGAVGLPTGGALIAGRSGSGKSTSCLSCLNSPLRCAGDDYVLLDLSGEIPWVWSLYGAAKVVPDNLVRLPWLQDWIDNPDHLETQKAIIYVNEQRPSAMIAGFPIRAILVPRISGQPHTRITPARSFDAMQAIAPTCVFHLVGDANSMMTKIAELCRRVPAFWLEAGTDLPQIPHRILEHLNA